MKSGEKVFCVFSGEYSDRRIDGIFSTRDKAQEYIDREKMCGNSDVDNEPTEEIIDEVKPRDIATIRIEQGHASIFDLWGDAPGEEDGWVKQLWNDDDYIVTVNFNPDEEVMFKAAYDRFAMWKAAKDGI